MADRSRKSMYISRFVAKMETGFHEELQPTKKNKINDTIIPKPGFTNPNFTQSMVDTHSFGINEYSEEYFNEHSDKYSDDCSNSSDNLLSGNSLNSTTERDVRIIEQSNAVPISSIHNDFDCKIDDRLIIIKRKSNITDNNIENDLELNLKRWSIEQDVKHCQLESLLKLLKKYHPSLHKSSKTILQTIRKLDITVMPDATGTSGEYMYFGIQRGLDSQFRNGICQVLHDINEIELICNVDGLPIFHSSNEQFWPILGKLYVKNVKITPFIIALFSGKSKPKNLDCFLRDFIQECNQLKEHGFCYEGQEYKFSLKFLICDAPARSYLKCIKPHNSYHGCEKCDVKGDRVNNRILFITHGNESKRSHESFILQSDSDHHLGRSPLLEIVSFDIIKGMPLDPMHLLYLGIMRRLLHHWIDCSSEFRISPSFRREMSRRLLASAKSFPREFNRKPSSLEEIDRWKATQFRSLLLYIGPFILNSLLPRNLYKHFMLLHCASRIACCDMFLKFHQQALLMIKECCNLFEKLYPNLEPVYNCHSLYHLFEEYFQNDCTIDDVSCFPFENYLGSLKKLVRTANRPFAQVCKRLLEHEHCPKNKYKNLKDNCVVIYKENSNGIVSFIYKAQMISIDYPDNVIILKHKKVMQVNKIIEIDNNIKLLGSIFQDTGNAYNTPIESEKLNIFKIRNLSSFEFTVDLIDVVMKCILMEYEQSHIAIGLLSHENTTV